MPTCFILHYYWNFFSYIDKDKFIKKTASKSLAFEEFLRNSELFFFFFFIMFFILFFFFVILDFFIFYILFELSMIPLFYIIGIYGTRSNKIKAAYYLFFFTLLGSVSFLLGILILYSNVGTTNYLILNFYTFDSDYQKFLWILFFIPIAVKIPIVPFHIWLPEAHVEAPTEGSVLLAGVMLKLGGYFLIRYLIPLFPIGTTYYTPLVYTACIISIIYTSILIFKQIDCKKIIAYSSIAHMNFALLGLFSGTLQGIQGCLYIFFTHGIISSGLFLSFGYIYNRYHTRLLHYYRGLTFYMPVLSVYFFLFILGNFAFPGTGGFVGEILVFTGLFQHNIFVGICSLVSSLLGAIYSCLFFTRIFFGVPFIYYKTKNNHMESLYTIELLILFFYGFLLLISGVFPNIFMNIVQAFSLYLSRII
jgi:proton-translocating NADH-quinone oxidoreductase chain M